MGKFNRRSIGLDAVVCGRNAENAVSFGIALGAHTFKNIDTNTFPVQHNLGKQDLFTL